MKKALRVIIVLLTGLWILLVSLAGFSARWGLTTWEELDLDEIIFHLQAPLTGTGNGMIRDYILKGALPAVLLFAGYLFLITRMKNARMQIGAALLCAALFCLAAVGIKNYIWQGLHVSQWLEDQKNESHFIRDNYVYPAKVKLKFPEKKRNLIFLYLESMETTFADQKTGGAFPRNVIPELTELAADSECFSGDTGQLNGGIVYKGTHNTMTAIFAHSTGLPLKVDIGDNNMDTQDSFFPGITALGDVLEAEGYRQVFLLGSDAAFGGRRLFFEDHGNFEVRDLLYARQKGWIPQDYNVFWGYEDEKLFQFARETLLELAEDDQPFNLSLLTVDTHFEDGYVCDLCRKDFGDNQYANVMACSSRQVCDFITWVQQQDFYENTTIVLTGDHTTMDKDFCTEVSPDYQRRTYTAYIHAAAEPAMKAQARTYSSLDTFPTTLAALGVEIEGNRLGLGANLFSGEPTLTEIYGKDFLAKEIPRRNTFLQKLESTESQTDALLERIQEKMQKAISITSYDSDTGQIDLEVSAAPDLYLAITDVEAACREKGSEKESRILLDKKKGENRVYTGTLDISGWKGPEGEIRISMKLIDGTEYRDIVTKELQELLE